MRAYLFMLNQLITPSTPAEFVTICAEKRTMLGAYTMPFSWNFDGLVYFLFFRSNSQKVAIKHSTRNGCRNKLIFLHSQQSLTAIIKSTEPYIYGVQLGIRVFVVFKQTWTLWFTVISVKMTTLWRPHTNICDVRKKCSESDIYDIVSLFECRVFFFCQKHKCGYWSKSIPTEKKRILCDSSSSSFFIRVHFSFWLRYFPNGFSLLVFLVSLDTSRWNRFTIGK